MAVFFFSIYYILFSIYSIEIVKKQYIFKSFFGRIYTVFERKSLF